MIRKIRWVAQANTKLVYTETTLTLLNKDTQIEHRYFGACLVKLSYAKRLVMTVILNAFKKLF